MKLLKKLVISSLVILMSANFNCFSLKAEDFDYSICHGDLSNADSETKKACRLYQEEKNQEANELASKIDEIKKEQEENMKNIEKGVAKVKTYNEEIERIEKEIKEIEESIKVAESNINELQGEIRERQDHIDEIDKNIRERMVALQSFMHINNYIDFLVGASSFMDLIRRMEALNDIQSYDDGLMNQLNEETMILNNDKEELERQLQTMEENRSNVEKEKSYVENLKKVAEELLVEYYKKEAELEEEEASLLEDLDEVTRAFDAATAALGEYVASSGWTKPVSGARLSASTWHYPKSFGGGIHLGCDLAASVGTTVKAVANGYVLYTVDKYNTYGYLGSRDGSPGSTGGGNQVYLIVTVGAKTYAVKYLHLKKDTPIRIGSVVSAGEKIGEVGSSGNSSGPHCHVEIFYLGTKSISYYVSRWNGDFSFGCGYNNDGLRHTCSNTGNDAPCRLEPAKVLGY